MLIGFSGCVRTVTLKKTDSDGVQSTEQIEFPVENHSRTPFPWFIVITSFIQIFVFFNYYLSENDPVNLWTFCAGCAYNDPSNPDRRLLGWLVYRENRVIQHGEYWRLLTYQFVHNGFFHLLHNVIAQCSVGIQLEAQLGSFHTALIYNFGVFLCPIEQWIMAEKAALIGASMGTYALLSGYIYQILLNNRNLKLSTGIVLSICCCLRMFYHDYETGNVHTCGYIAGIYIVFIVLKDVRPVHGHTVHNICGVVFFAFLTIVYIRDSYVIAVNAQIQEDYDNEMNYFDIFCFFNPHICFPIDNESASAQ